MTERLEEIEKNLDPLGYGMGGHLISVNDIYWLVKYAREQAERVQELEKRLKIYQKRSWFEDYEKVAKQNKRYREALEFYANERNYKERDFGIIVQPAIQEGDRGKTARKALEGEE